MSKSRARASGTPAATAPHYEVTAFPLTIYYNREGDHDHNGMMFALSANAPVLRYIRALTLGTPPTDASQRPEQLYGAALARAQALGMELPVTPAQARQPHPLVRPLVLRARVREQITVRLENQIRHRPVGLHLVAAGWLRRQNGRRVARREQSRQPGRGAHDERSAVPVAHLHVALRPRRCVSVP